jgi:lysophospholipase L1-like esterase
MATTLAGLADEPADHVNDTGAPTTVFVHAGHNDAQLSDDAARVSPERFRDASATLDRWLTDEPSVDNHAFVGLVPLLDLDEPESVPFADAQPGRSRRYDNRLADAVSTHVGVVASPPDWEARTVDGVHPNGAGHSAIADRVLAWLQ